tara:strand:- start:2050 stop:2511 length:462 start_codon:yes stop_codon:yes gene_type:complete
MINGSYSVLYVKWQGNFLPIGCLTSDSFSEESEMLDTTTRDNGGWKTSRPTSQNYNISFDGLVQNTNFIGGDFNKISLDRLTVLKRSRTLIEWKTQDNNFVFVDSGFGYITSLSDLSNVNEFISFTCEIEGFVSPESETSGVDYLQFELQHDI